MSFPRATPSAQSPFQPSQPSTTPTVPSAPSASTSSSSARAQAAWERGRVRRGRETADDREPGGTGGGDCYLAVDAVDVAAEVAVNIAAEVAAVA